MSHTELADFALEHVAAELWESEARGERSTVEELGRSVRVERLEDAIGVLGERGLLRVEDGVVRLTPEGRTLGQSVVRRHRLAEFLFSTVFDVADDHDVNQTACVMEHVLSPSVTESVCSFLGHPKFCPHGKPIPPGACCRSFSGAVEPLVQPLDQLGVGCSAKIVYIVPRDPARLVKLSDLGLVPGTVVRLQQKRPAVVLAIGETTLALDRDIAAEIYIKRHE